MGFEHHGPAQTRKPRVPKLTGCAKAAWNDDSVYSLSLHGLGVPTFFEQLAVLPTPISTGQLFILLEYPIH
ncbi:hypothetical protein, partial [Cupriavidus sp. 8B]